jgi:hypothetical protein
LAKVIKMVSYTTTNILNSKYSLSQVNGENVLSITDGSKTYNMKGVQLADNNNVVVGVGKTVFGTGNSALKVFSVVYKQSPPNSDPTYSIYIAKVDPNNDVTSSTDLWANQTTNITKPDFLECMVGLDLDGDGVIGPKNLTVVSQTINNRTITDVGDQFLAKDTSGVFYILDKTEGTDLDHKINSVKVGAIWYDALLVREQWNGFQTPSGFDYQDDKNTANSSKAIAVVKSDTAPPSDGGYSPMSQGNTAGYYVAIKRTSEWSSKPTWDIKKINLTGELQNWGNISTEKISKYEAFFGQDLNGDNTIGAADPTAITGDSSADGVVAGRNTDGDLFIKVDNGPFKIIKSAMGGYSIESSSTNNQSVVVAATDTDQPAGTYLLALKKSSINANDVNSIPTITWDVFTVRTKEAYLIANQATSGGSSSGSYATTGAAATGAMLGADIGTGDLVMSQYNMNDVARNVSIGEYEAKFGQDLNGDGFTGLNKANIKALSTDTQGVRLERDAKDNSLFIANGTGDSRSLLSITGAAYLESDSKGTGWGNKREAIAVEAIRDNNNVITGYKLAFKRSEFNDYGPTMSAGPAAMGGGGTAAAPKISWDIYFLDDDGKILSGAYDNTTRMWKDDTVQNAPSIASYEAFFGEDLNGDGKTGIDAASLSMSALDKAGVKLGRDAYKSLYIVDGTKIKAIGNASWLEYANSWGNGSNETKAVAVEAIRDSNNAITGYKLALKQTNVYDGNTTVSWDILKLDADAKVTYGYYDSVTSNWKDDSVRGQKSIAPFEDFFGDDLNEDGRTGVDVASLIKVSTDTFGILLARDKEKSLYLLDGNNAKAVSASWLEYSNSWGNGSNKKEAIAAEAVRNGAGTITGYKIALKQTDVYDGKTTINWDVVTLTAEAKLENGSGAAMMGGSSQTKSIAAFESVFNQDLNDDGRIGIDIANLIRVSTDTTGLYLARDAEKAMYIVDGNSAKAVGNSSWLEYDNNWGSGSNKREAIAVEAVKDSNGNITAYKLAMKQTNNWNGTDNVTWDVLHLNTEAQITYGAWSSTENKWVDNSVYGAKSMVAYEALFNQDLNNDGNIGIDVASLKLASTDTHGVRLARDKDNALFIVDGAAAKAVGNASWLEYNNTWANGANKMEAVAVEATRDNSGNITGYKLALKQTNDWNGNKDENWQVLNLDAQGNVNWSGTGGGSLFTKKIRQVENLVQEDLNNDGTTGISITTLNAFTEERLTGADDKVKLAKDSADNAYYIVDNTTAIALVDSYGSNPELTYSRQWVGGSNTSEVMGVAKQTVGGDYQYRIAVKVTNTYGTSNEVSWQIHTVNKAGVLDWSKVATARSPGRFENIFGQDLDGVTNDTATAIATDTGTVKLLKDGAGVLTIQNTSDTDNNGITYLVDAQGGSPSFDYDTGSSKSESYAINKLADDTYRLAVKKTSANQTVKWEVYTVGVRNADTDEAAINRTKTVYLKDVRDVEALINQDINGDGTVGRPTETTDVAKDDGVVKAALTAQNQLYINNNGAKIAVVDSFGVGVILNKSESWDAGTSSFIAEVVTAEKVVADNVTTYKIALRETLILKNQEPTISWKIYTTDASGVLNPKPVETDSIARWEPLFNQDLTPNEGASLGVDPASLQPLIGDSDVALDSHGAIFVRNGGSLIQVTDGADGSISFESSETLPDGFSTSKVVGAQAQDDGNILLAVEYASQVGDVSNKSWVVHTLNVKGTGASAYAVIDWTHAVVTDDMTDYATLFGQTFSQDVVTLGS